MSLMSIGTLLAADIDLQISQFKLYRDVLTPVTGTIPEVVEVPTLNPTYTSGFLIVDQSTHTRVPTNTFLTWKKTEIENMVESDGFPKLTDNNQETYASYAYTATNHEASIMLTATDGPVTSSRISITLDSYVEAPDTVELYALIGGVRRTVVAKRPLSSLDFYFPETESEEWELVLNYTQPLRIREVKLHDANKRVEQVPETVVLRFLAQPKTSYRIYENDEKITSASLQETREDSSILNIPQNKIRKVTPKNVEMNTLYREPDADGDTIPDSQDNCKTIQNLDQVDENSNGKGDLCEDYDYDGFTNNIDNCKLLPNRDQRDADSDGVGDVCDSGESRLTEKYPWLPWVGIISAFVVLIGLFAVTVKTTLPKAI